MAQEIGPNQRKWIDELRSGKWEQGRDGYLIKDGKACCLGVGCEIFEVKKRMNRDHIRFGEEESNGYAPNELIHILALRDRYGTISNGQIEAGDGSYDKIYEANDYGATFDQIADFCEQHPEAVYTEPR